MDDELSKRVIGCAYEVSNTLGAGFFERVYEKALCIELDKTGLGYVCQKPVLVEYKGYFVGEYIADIVVEDQLLLELKALSTLCREHEAQLMNYLKATGLSVGLLLNFGRPRLGIKRMIWSHNETKNI
ncbi:MAG: GxxExxY protein [Gammaproteobacteria bacterium]|nr:GxxExxY protein [Gammaproteobacteria bacterium]